MRESVVFYRSFANAIRDLPPDQFKACAMAIINYGLNGIEPEGNGIEKTVFCMAKPQIDANNRRYENGTKGGRPKTKQNLDITKPNLDATKLEPKEKEKEKVKEKVKDKDNIYSCAFEEFWEAYPRKKEKAKAYKCYKARLADGFSEDELETAVKRYADECKINHAEEKYIKLGATFLGPNTPFTDYLGDWKPPEKEKKQQKKNQFNNFHQREYDFDDLERQLVGR